MAQNRRTHVQYRVDFLGKWISPSAFFAGLAIFLLIIKYFAIEDIGQIGFGEVTFSLVLPLLILVLYGVLLRGFRFRVTPVYGILAALYCLLMIIRAFSYGSTGGIVLAVIWYLLAGALSVVITFGYITGRGYLMLAFLIPVVYRVVFTDILTYFQVKDWAGLLAEISALSGFLAFSLFALCLKLPKKK